MSVLPSFAQSAGARMLRCGCQPWRGAICDDHCQRQGCVNGHHTILCVAGERDDDCPACHRSWTWTHREDAYDAALQACAPLCQDDWHVNHHTEETP